jgi:hypothetical protein
MLQGSDSFLFSTSFLMEQPIKFNSRCYLLLNRLEDMKGFSGAG